MAEAPVTSVEYQPSAVVVYITARNLGKIEIDALCAGIDKAQAAAPSLPFILDMSNVGFAGSLAIGVTLRRTRQGASCAIKSGRQNLNLRARDADVLHIYSAVI